jgi:hypothetical protein
MIKENRVSKYLFYAIGEIALVMIGILLALQVNNWNEQQKDQMLIANYTENLIEDLVLDSISISERIIGIEADSTKLADFERRVFQSTAPLDTIYQIARYEYDYLIWIHPDFNNDTYMVLNSTGGIGLFDKELISELNALYNLQELALNATRHTLESYVNNVHSYAKKYPVSFQSNLIKNGSSAADLIWGQISLIDHSTEFNALVLAKGDSYRLALRYLPRLLEQTNALLSKLRKQ